MCLQYLCMLSVYTIGSISFASFCSTLFHFCNLELPKIKNASPVIEQNTADTINTFCHCSIVC